MNEVNEINDWQMDAMAALFRFSEAMVEGNLSIQDLADVMEKAIDSGADLMLVHLAMAQMSLNRAIEMRADQNE